MWEEAEKGKFGDFGKQMVTQKSMRGVKLAMLDVKRFKDEDKKATMNDVFGGLNKALRAGDLVSLGAMMKEFMDGKMIEK